MVQTAVVPPSTGKVIFANIGSIRNSRAALMNRVIENSATEIEPRREAATGSHVATLSEASGKSRRRP